MYVSDLALWLGWAVFYGSIGVSIGFVVLSSRSLRPCDTGNDCSTSDLATHIARTGAACRDGSEPGLSLFRAIQVS
jgi:hypothetical protein